MSAASAASFNHMPDETAATIPPEPSEIFKKRAARLHCLSTGHAIGKYLKTMARLAEAQLAASRIIPSTTGEIVTQASSLNACYHTYGEVWHKVFNLIVSEMQGFPLPERSQATLSRLKSTIPALLEYSAQTIVCGSEDAVDLAASPFLAAALQVYWTDLASRIKPETAERLANVCPMCGSPPVAGVILSGRKLRYLCCSLCATHWNFPRLVCTHCGSTEGISYFAVDGHEDGGKAEACGRCNTYLKLFYLESNPEAEAFADDLATLPLDLLMSDRSYSRSGINLFLIGR